MPYLEGNRICHAFDHRFPFAGHRAPSGFHGLLPGLAQAFNPDANGDGQVGAGDIIAVLAVYGLPFDATDFGPSVLHFDPDTIGTLPLGYDLYIAEDFTFPYLYVTVPDGDFPGQSFGMAVEKQPDMDNQQIYLQDTEGNWLALARQFETNGRFAEPRVDRPALGLSVLD